MKKKVKNLQANNNEVKEVKNEIVETKKVKANKKSKKENTTMFPTAKNTKSLINKLTADVDLQKIKSNEWWNQAKNVFKPGDIIFYETLNKFAIFIKPARKLNLIEIRLLKNNSKTEVYTRNWYINVNDARLVKRGDTVKRGFIETDSDFELIKSQSHKDERAQ